jgi:hypothetical protein
MQLLIIQHNHLTLHAFILIGSGLAIRYIIGRRRFNRRGIAGLQLFSSYEKWWLTTRIEALVYFLGLLAILAGAFLLIFK